MLQVLPNWYLFLLPSVRCSRTSLSHRKTWGKVNEYGRQGKPNNRWQKWRNLDLVFSAREPELYTFFSNTTITLPNQKCTKLSLLVNLLSICHQRTHTSITSTPQLESSICFWSFITVFLNEAKPVYPYADKNFLRKKINYFLSLLLVRVLLWSFKWSFQLNLYSQKLHLYSILDSLFFPCKVASFSWILLLVSTWSIELISFLFAFSVFQSAFDNLFFFLAPTILNLTK